MKIHKLYLKSFRGATQPLTVNFSPDKNITLIYAENGNGKSTIADSFECLCTENFGSISDKSGGDLSYLKSIGSINSDLLIELTSDSQKYKATLSGSTNKIIKSPNSGLPIVKALRRAQITSFIDDAPAQRYKVLATFIDVSNIEKSETELKKLIISVERDYNADTKSLSVAQQTLTEIWNKEGNPQGNLDLWVQSEIVKDNTKLAIEFKENETVLQSWHSLHQTVQNIKAEKNKFDDFSKKLIISEQKLKEYLDKNPNSESDLLSLLNETKNFLSTQSSIEKCPVCEKDSEKERLLKSVSDRLANMKELNTLSKEVNDFKIEKNRLQTRLQAQIDPFNSQLIDFKTASILLPNFNYISLLNLVLDKNTTKDNYKEYQTVENQLLAEIEKLNKHNQGVNKSLGQNNSIKTNNASIVSFTKKCNELSILLEKAKEALKIVEDTRKDFIDNELNSISDEVEKMYQAIHPNEGLGNIKLFLNHSFQGSLNLSANFHTEADITPQSVYSESHLDTLGICIFIALAKKDSAKDVILILDDVVMSVDERHLDRIIDLIHNEAKNFGHILITTHYRPWRERYRNNRAPNSGIQFIELRSWTKERGISLAKPLLVLEEIKWYLAKPENFHRENLAGVTGRFLEAVLDFLSLNFQSKLKRKAANDYTLSELLDCLSKDLLKVLKVQKMLLLPDGTYCKVSFTDEILLKSTIDNLKSLKAIRNQVGAHFTFDGALVGDNDIEDFAKYTIELAELLLCPKDGNLPHKNISGSYWETKRGSIRLFPLLEP